MPAAPHELLLFVAPKSEACVTAQAQAAAAAAQLTLPFRVVDASLPVHARLVMGFNICELPTLVLLRDGKQVKTFEEPKDFKTAALVDRITRLLAKETTRV
jgi:thioredoxin-like negative regulator of GroEL